jgi:hypothetical protein
MPAARQASTPDNARPTYSMRSASSSAVAIALGLTAGDGLIVEHGERQPDGRAD